MSEATFTMGSGGLPAGSYPIEFARIEPFTENVEKYGPAVQLVFKVTGGDHAGEEDRAVCSAKLTPKSKLSKFATGLKGSSVASGEKFNFADYIGTKGIIVVEELDGVSRVTTFVRS